MFCKVGKINYMERNKCDIYSNKELMILKYCKNLYVLNFVNKTTKFLQILRVFFAQGMITTIFVSFLFKIKSNTV